MGAHGAAWGLLLLSAALSCGGQVVDPDSRQRGGSGTTAAGKGCSCPDIGCLEGYMPVAPAPGECCSSGCVLDCRDVVCNDRELNCDPGLSPGKLPDECCPLCLPGSPKSCEDAREQYESLRSELLALYSTNSCDQVGCSLFTESNRCAVNCGTPITSLHRDSMQEQLQNFADNNCSACPRSTFSCSEPAAFSCRSHNTCQFDPIGAK